MRKISLIVGLLMVLAVLVSIGYAKSMEHNNKTTALQEKSNKSAVGVKGNAINNATDQQGLTVSVPLDQDEFPSPAAPYTDRLEDLRNAQAANNGNNNSYIGYVNPLLPAMTFYINPDYVPETNQAGTQRNKSVPLAVNANPDMETEDIAPADDVPDSETESFVPIKIPDPDNSNDEKNNKYKAKRDNSDKQKDGDRPDNDDELKDKNRPNKDDEQKDKDKRDNSDKKKDRDIPDNDDDEQKDKNRPNNNDEQKDKDKRDNSDKKKDRDISDNDDDEQKDKDKDKD